MTLQELHPSALTPAAPPQPKNMCNTISLTYTCGCSVPFSRSTCLGNFVPRGKNAGTRQSHRTSRRLLCTARPLIILAIPRRCGACEIANTKTLGQKALEQREGIVDNLRSKIRELLLRSHGGNCEAEIATVQTALGQAEAAVHERMQENFKTEMALLGSIPDFLDRGQKRIAAPQQIHRGRTESVLRRDVHPDQVVLNTSSHDGVDSSLLHETENVPVLTPDFQEDEADWTPREDSDEEGMGYDCWTVTGQEDWFVYKDPGWQEFRSRSFLSPVEEKAEPEWEQVLSTGKLGCEAAGGREEVVTPEERSEIRQDSPLAVPVNRKKDDAEEHVKDLASSRSGLEVPRGDVGSRQVSAAHGLEVAEPARHDGQDGRKKRSSSRSRSPLPWIWRKAVTAAQ